MKKRGELLKQFREAFENAEAPKKRSLAKMFRDFQSQIEDMKKRAAAEGAQQYTGFSQRLHNFFNGIKKSSQDAVEESLGEKPEQAPEEVAEQTMAAEQAAEVTVVPETPGDFSEMVKNLTDKGYEFTETVNPDGSKTYVNADKDFELTEKADGGMELRGSVDKVVDALQTNGIDSVKVEGGTPEQTWDTIKALTENKIKVDNIEDHQDLFKQFDQNGQIEQDQQQMKGSTPTASPS